VRGVAVHIEGTEYCFLISCFSCSPLLRALRGELFLHGVENFLGGFHAEVGGEQSVFDFLEDGGIDLAAALGDGVEGVGEGFFGLPTDSLKRSRRVGSGFPKRVIIRVARNQ